MNENSNSKESNSRRAFLLMSSGALAAAAVSQLAFSGAPASRRPRAILFDAFPIFDPRPVNALVEARVPEKGRELSELWRARIFEYQWLRGLAGRYTDFEHAVREALAFATSSLKIELAAAHAEELVRAYSNLKAWPDVRPALDALKAMGLKIGFLSNMTEPMLRANAHGAGLDDAFDIVLSTDQVKAFKPDPRAYALASEALGLDKREILFVAFAGWDVAGAMWYGLPTFWVNRMQAVPEFGMRADGEGRGLDDLLRFVRA